MKIAIGSDHAGFQYKEAIKQMLIDLGHDVTDKGTYAATPSVDYPLFIRPVLFRSPEHWVYHFI